MTFFVLGFCEVKRRFGRSCVCSVSEKRTEIGIGQLTVERLRYLDEKSLKTRLSIEQKLATAFCDIVCFVFMVSNS